MTPGMHRTAGTTPNAQETGPAEPAEPAERAPGDPAAVFGPVRPAARPNQRTTSSMLMAAMLGLADGMGFERPRTELVAVADAEPGEGALIIGFGPLDPLD